MATVKAYYGIDSQMLDLNFYSRHFFDDFFYEDIDFRYEGRTYQDIYSINGWDLQNDLVISVLGRGFGFNSWGTVIQGTVTAITEEIYDGDMIWIAQDVSVSAARLYDAGLTPGDADDRAVFASMMAGNDTVNLSAFGDRFEGWAGHDRMFGHGGNDTLIGGSGNDVLEGGSGIDRLVAGDGQDQLRGGTGKDRLEGGGGQIRWKAARARTGCWPVWTPRGMSSSSAAPVTACAGRSATRSCSSGRVRTTSTCRASTPMLGGEETRLSPLRARGPPRIRSGMSSRPMAFWSRATRTATRPPISRSGWMMRRDWARPISCSRRGRLCPARSSPARH